jgi:primosomal protein N' (replication factor Y)
MLGIVVGMSDTTALDPARLLEPRRALLGLPADLDELADWVAAEYCSTRARALSLVLPPAAERGAAMQLVAELTPAGAASLEDAGVRLTSGQRALLERLRDEGALAPGPQLATARRLATRGLLVLERRERGRRPVHASVGRAGEARPLTPQQRAALDALEAGGQFLLHGVTGSGKTEVYLQAAARTLDAGRGAIVLVPEIGLTPQTVSRFVERFGDTVAVLHSKLSAGERHDEWLRLRRGEARICVGPRSAVFAPVDRLGLIVVDEEHDPSYKHEGDPRYDARHVAQERARRAGAVLVCGSATPRPESHARLRALRMDERVDGRPLPRVDILDMRGVRHALHPATAQALAALRRDGGKAIVLLNRRGWSNFLSCGSCGRVWGCPQCDVALVLHNAEGFVACHHCGHREGVPRTCCDCGSASVARHGLGTERLEHELVGALGDVPVFRLDADVAARKGAAAQLLRRFERAAGGILIGTQMVAKGHDFGDVSLGVVLDADATLRFPDFRSEERTFALLTQLAGRVGRGGDGRVLVQTMAPQASSIRLAAAHDSDTFLAAELERRRALGYPPCGELVRIVCSAEDAESAAGAARALREAISGAVTVLGPAPLFRLRGRERAQLLVKAARRADAVAAVGAAVAQALPPRDVSLSVDVDPQ